VEYIGGDSNVSAVADVDYFRRKMSAALKIPMAYLGGDEYAAVRTGLAQMDVYFARMVKKLQRSAIRGTGKLFFTHLRLREVKYSPDEVRIGMEPVSGIEEMQRIEALTAAVMLAQQMFMTGTAMGIPPQYWVPYILKDIMKIADEDILRMPIDPAQIMAVNQMQQDQGQDQQPGGEGDDRRMEMRKELVMKIQEEISKPDYQPLRKFLATETNVEDILGIDERELPPSDLKRRGKKK